MFNNDRISILIIAFATKTILQFAIKSHEFINNILIKNNNFLINSTFFDEMSFFHLEMISSDKQTNHKNIDYCKRKELRFISKRCGHYACEIECSDETRGLTLNALRRSGS